jgi:hypothetical protein
MCELALDVCCADISLIFNALVPQKSRNILLDSGWIAIVGPSWPGQIDAWGAVYYQFCRRSIDEAKRAALCGGGEAHSKSTEDNVSNSLAI